MRKMIAGAVSTVMALGLAVAGQAMAQEKLTVWWVKGFYKAEDDALFAAIKKFEEKHKGVKIELSQYPVQDMIPKTVSALDSGSPPDVAYADVYDFQVTGKWAFDGKLEDISSVHRPDERALRAEHGRDHLPLQRQDQDRPTTRSRSSSRRCTSSTGSTCWPSRLQGVGHPDHLEGLLVVLVRQGPAGQPPEDRQAHLRHRHADGRGFERLVLFVPDLHGRLQRQAGQRQRQAAGRRPDRAGRA